MKRYIEHIKTKEPHERRKHAMQLSGTLVALLFVAWLASFGARLGAPADAGNTAGDSSQTASAANSTTMQDGQAQLEVSTTSVYSY